MFKFSKKVFFGFFLGLICFALTPITSAVKVKLYLGKGKGLQTVILPFKYFKRKPNDEFTLIYESCYKIYDLDKSDPNEVVVIGNLDLSIDVAVTDGKKLIVFNVNRLNLLNHENKDSLGKIIEENLDLNDKSSLKVAIYTVKDVVKWNMSIKGYEKYSKNQVDNSYLRFIKKIEKSLKEVGIPGETIKLTCWDLRTGKDRLRYQINGLGRYEYSEHYVAIRLDDLITEKRLEFTSIDPVYEDTFGSRLVVFPPKTFLEALEFFPEIYAKIGILYDILDSPEVKKWWKNCCDYQIEMLLKKRPQNYKVLVNNYKREKKELKTSVDSVKRKIFKELCNKRVPVIAFYTKKKLLGKNGCKLPFLNMDIVDNTRKIGPKTIPGYILRDVNPNGNCFYESVIDQFKLINHNFMRDVPVSTEPHDLLRLKVQDSYGGEFVDREWAGYEEIVKLMYLYRVIVAIIDTRYPNSGFIYHYFDCRKGISYTRDRANLPSRQPIIRLAYTGNHYLSVLTEVNNDEALFSGLPIFIERNSAGLVPLHSSELTPFASVPIFGRSSMFPTNDDITFLLPRNMRDKMNNFK